LGDKERKMPFAKEEVLKYADEKFIVWLEDHIRYFQTLLSDLEGIYSVYQELLAEQEFGWIPAPGVVHLMNEAKEKLELLIFELLQHQKMIIISKSAFEISQRQSIDSKNSKIKRFIKKPNQTEDPSI